MCKTQRRLNEYRNVLVRCGCLHGWCECLRLSDFISYTTRHILNKTSCMIGIYDVWQRISTWLVVTNKQNIWQWYTIIVKVMMSCCCCLCYVHTPVNRITCPRHHYRTQWRWDKSVLSTNMLVWLPAQNIPLDTAASEGNFSGASYLHQQTISLQFSYYYHSY